VNASGSRLERVSLTLHKSQVGFAVEDIGPSSTSSMIFVCLRPEDYFAVEIEYGACHTVTTNIGYIEPGDSYRDVILVGSNTVVFVPDGAEKTW
jgi:hypothetical protein